MAKAALNKAHQVNSRQEETRYVSEEQLRHQRKGREVTRKFREYLSGRNKETNYSI